MSVLSITAPQFSTQDEQLEQEGCTNQELQEAHRDVFGTPHIEPVELENEKLEELLCSFAETLSQIPMDQKGAYLDALELAPKLMELEANPRAFLKAEHYDHSAATDRFVNYWELRKWLFGERCWLPMTSTGNGALCSGDIEVLKSGFCTLLTKDDEHGRGVIYFRVTPHKIGWDRMALVRVIFYVFSIAQEKSSVQDQGLVLVADTKHYTTSRFDRKFIKTVAYLFTGYHPVNTCAFHICAPPGKSCFLLVLPFIRYFMTRAIRQRFLVHTGTAAECALDLRDYGIPTDILLDQLGDCSLSQFEEWLHERQSLERTLEETMFGNQKEKIRG